MVRAVHIAGFALVLLMAGCSRSESTADGRVLARVGERILTDAQVPQIYPAEVSAEDSARILEDYVRSWVVRQLKMDEAARLPAVPGQDIDALVEDYRASLLNHRFDRYYIDSRLDTLFRAEEIRSYYDRHRNDFLLDRILVKGSIVRMPADSRQRGRIKTLMGSLRSESRRDFEDLCLKNGFELLQFDNWVDFSEFLSWLPVRRGGSYESLAARRDVQEMPGADSWFYFRIDDCRKPGEPNPLERVSGTIGRILFNQRRTELIRRCEDSLYHSALNSDRAEILLND